ncbi:MAG: hypothetical protein EPO68_06915 [Planctomycetota bacterium]|nr:MAG: hypothetical protein EPO68_06915 [Planctomycetota bacterium]
MKRFPLLAALAVLALAIALAWSFMPSNGADRASDGVALDRDAPLARASTDAALSDAEPVAAVEPAATQPSARTPIGAVPPPALGRGTIHGRVLVGLGRSTSGAAVQLVGPLPAALTYDDDRWPGTDGPTIMPPAHPLLPPNEDGTFAWPDLAPGRYRVDLFGVDDLWTNPDTRTVALAADQLVEVVWDLSRVGAARVDLELRFDGVPTLGTVEPILMRTKIGEPFTTDASGRVSLGELGRVNQSESVQFGLYATNRFRQLGSPRDPLFGQIEVLATLQPCERRTLVADIRTSRVRIVSAHGATAPLPNPDGTL